MEDKQRISSDMSLTNRNTNQDYTMKFFSDNGATLMGTLDFKGPKLVFMGKMEESAKVFFDFIAEAFSERLKEERERTASPQLARMLNYIEAERFTTEHLKALGRIVYLFNDCKEAEEEIFDFANQLYERYADTGKDQAR